LFKVLSYSSVSITIKFAVGFLLTKILAYFLGPSGFALLGNFKNTAAVINSLTSLGMYKGIVRYTSESKNKIEEFQRLISAINLIAIISSLLIAVFLLFMAEQLSIFVLQDPSYAYLFQGLAVVLPFSTFQIFFFSILNGLGNYKRVIGLEIMLNVCNLLITTLFICKYGLSGALLSIIILPIFYFLFTLFFLKKGVSNWLVFFKIKFNHFYGSQLGIYALMTLFSGVTFPLIFIGIRNEISTIVNIQAAGYWEAVNQFSYFYFLAINSLLLMYGLPKITENTSLETYQKLVKSYFLKLMPLFGLFLVALFFMREFAINLILTDAFLPSESLFFWQLLGDYLRAATLVIVILFHARRMIWHYILTDAVLALMMYFFSVSLIQTLGVEGAVKGHFFSYFIYLCLIVITLRKELFSSSSSLKSL